MIIILSLKESLTLFQIWIFYYTFTYFVPFGVIENRITKVNSKYFNGTCTEAWLFKKFAFELDASSYSFKITYILLSYVISLKKVAVSLAKFTILNMVSYLHSFNSFISINETCKYVSRNNV